MIAYTVCNHHTKYAPILHYQAEICKLIRNIECPMKVWVSNQLQHILFVNSIIELDF